jgi:hypothetical protein
VVLGRTECSTGALGALVSIGAGSKLISVLRRATKLIEKTKEREKLTAEAAAQEREFEEEDDGGIEIEGLERVEDETGGKGTAAEDEEEEAEEARPVRRRPIIEIQ